MSIDSLRAQAISAQIGARRRVTDLPLPVVLMCIGIFTVSWDRFAQVYIGTYNVKLPIVMFALAGAAALHDAMGGRGRQAIAGVRPVPAVFAMLTVAIVGLLIVAGLVGDAPAVSVVQTGVLAVGSLLPFWVVYAVVRTYGVLDAALTALIRGAYVASVFGLYQLAAFYTGLPQIVEYRAESGGLGRISSFSYEAGYFGYFLILVIGAVFARDLLRTGAVRPGPLLFFVTVLVLSNTRATLFTIPVVFVLLLLNWPARYARPRFGAVIVLGAAWAVAGLALFWGLIWRMVERVLTVFDPTEASSNAPRLEVLTVAAEVGRDNPWWGVGAGNFGKASSEHFGELADLAGNRAIVNNVWFQALMDGGLLLVIAEAALVLAVLVVLYRWRTPVARALASGWLAVIAVASMITSYYFDLKLWVVLGMAVAAFVAEARPASSPVRERSGGPRGH